MATINVKCPGCGKGYEVPDTAVGKKTRCKKCDESFTVEDPEAGSLDFTSPAKKTDKPKPDKDKPVWWKTLHHRWWFWVILLLVGLNGLTRWTGGSGGKPDNTKLSAELAKTKLELTQTKGEVEKVNAELAFLKAQPKTNPAMAAELAKAKEALAIAQGQLVKTNDELTKAKAAAGAKMPEPRFKSDIIKGSWKGTWGAGKKTATTWTVAEVTETDDKAVVKFSGTFEHPGDGTASLPYVGGKVVGSFNILNGEVRARLVPGGNNAPISITGKLNDGGTAYEALGDAYTDITYKLEKAK